MRVGEDPGGGNAQNQDKEKKTAQQGAKNNRDDFINLGWNPSFYGMESGQANS